MNHWTSEPVAVQRSWPRSQYSYCADRNWTRNMRLPTLACWLIFNLSFRKRQQRSMIWVPDFTLRDFFLPGSLCVLISTYFGAIHTNLPLILARVCLWGHSSTGERVWIAFLWGRCIQFDDMTRSGTQRSENKGLCLHFDLLVHLKVPVRPAHRSAIGVHVHRIFLGFTSERGVAILVPEWQSEEQYRKTRLFTSKAGMRKHICRLSSSCSSILTKGMLCIFASRTWRSCWRFSSARLTSPLRIASANQASIVATEIKINRTYA